MTTIVKATTKGQITLPAVWRKRFNTTQFILDYSGDIIKIQPIDIKEIMKKQYRKKELVIFNSIRDNKGNGMNAKNLLRVLKKIDE
ncbi:MAG: hypothetical protein US76_00645 [Parcubacteria group bacterium GW2011_GWA2_38_13b]|nr:MAG: hypothetical protein US76_00645 [Parcubacteria group bacterium GW2011_GWA2_38_13b]